MALSSPVLLLVVVALLPLLASSFVYLPPPSQSGLGSVWLSSAAYSSVIDGEPMNGKGSFMYLDTSAGSAPTSGNLYLRYAPPHPPLILAPEALRFRLQIFLR